MNIHFSKEAHILGRAVNRCGTLHVGLLCVVSTTSILPRRHWGDHSALVRAACRVVEEGRRRAVNNEPGHMHAHFWTGKERSHRNKQKPSTGYGGRLWRRMWHCRCLRMSYLNLGKVEGGWPELSMVLNKWKECAFIAHFSNTAFWKL